MIQAAPSSQVSVAFDSACMRTSLASVDIQLLMLQCCISIHSSCADIQQTTRPCSRPCVAGRAAPRGCDGGADGNGL
jgi:hypothetical protein